VNVKELVLSSPNGYRSQTVEKRRSTWCILWTAGILYSQLEIFSFRTGAGPITVDRRSSSHL